MTTFGKEMKYIDYHKQYFRVVVRFPFHFHLNYTALFSLVLKGIFKLKIFSSLDELMGNFASIFFKLFLAIMRYKN